MNSLNIGVSGLLAFQRQLDVTSHNIANVATDGYSRQRAELTPASAQFLSGSYYGNGVEVATVRRWTRADWGDEGDTMAWCCTEAHEAPGWRSPKTRWLQRPAALI